MDLNQAKKAVVPIMHLIGLVAVTAAALKLCGVSVPLRASTEAIGIVGIGLLLAK